MSPDHHSFGDMMHADLATIAAVERCAALAARLAPHDAKFVYDTLSLVVPLKPAPQGSPLHRLCVALQERMARSWRPTSA